MQINPKDAIAIAILATELAIKLGALVRKFQQHVEGREEAPDYEVVLQALMHADVLAGVLLNPEHAEKFAEGTRMAMYSPSLPLKCMPTSIEGAEAALEDLVALAREAADAP